ncbi:MAG: T9SS type A sorting domain-containing protein [Ignavibacteria bacterium]|nr:T9SS type A sorting domain-containing protein [Ignavibacteria bacterium]
MIGHQFVSELDEDSRWRSIYKFDLSVIPTNAVITDAKVRSWVTGYSETGFGGTTYKARIRVLPSTVSVGACGTDQTCLGTRFDDIMTGTQVSEQVYSVDTVETTITSHISANLSNRFVIFGGVSSVEDYNTSVAVLNFFLKIKYYVPITVTVDQKLSVGTSTGSVGRWQGGPDFVNSTAPANFTFIAPSTEALRGAQDIQSGEKYNQWFKASTAQTDVTNHHLFTIDASFPNNLTSQFKPTNNATLQAQVLDNGSIGGTLSFMDPWLIDYADPSYGNKLRNQGMSAPFNPVAYSVNNLGTATSYLGVLLNQNPNFLQGVANYSVSALSVQVINGYTAFFSGWTVSPGGAASFQSPSSTTTAVVFNSAGATLIANYSYSTVTYSTTLPSGTWPMAGTVTVPASVTLTILAGATVNFSGYYKLRIEGTLSANGSSTNPVIFQGSGYPGSWFGIEFYNAPWNQSLGYCVIKDATYALNSITSHFVPYALTVRGNTYGVNCSNYSDPGFWATVFDWNDWDVYGDNTSAPSLGMPTGYNSFRNPGYYQVYSTYPGTIYARGNWWGTCSPNPLVTANVDYSEWFCSDPNPKRTQSFTDSPVIQRSMVSNSSLGSVMSESGLSGKDPGMNQVEAAVRLYLDGKYEQALQAFERNVTKYPEYFSGCRSLVFMERTLEKLGRSGEILASLNNTATTYDGKLVGKFAASRRVYQYINQGRYQDAVAQASEVVQQNADTTLVKFALYDLGSSYWYGLGDTRNGALYYGQLIARFPNDPLSRSAQVTLGSPVGPLSKPGAVATRSSSSTEFDLQNYPNPFNPSTTISYQLTAKGSVSLRIYNMLGQEVAALVDGERLPGYHQAMWDASRNPSGVYVYQLIATDEKGQKQVARKRMLLLK